MLKIFGTRFRFHWAYITQPNGIRAYSLSILAILLVGFLAGLIIDSRVNPLFSNQSEMIYLDQLPWYGRMGFTSADTHGFDLSDPNVRLVSPLPINLNKEFNIQPGKGINQFALATEITLTDRAIQTPLAIYVAELGENWAVYMNGQLVRQEIFLSDENTIKTYRSVQRPFILLPKDSLRVGKNSLVFRLIGNRPTTRYFTGLFPGISMASGFMLGPANHISRLRTLHTAISYFQIGMYTFWGIFMFIFFRRRKEIYALLFGVFLLIFAGYSFFSSIPVFDSIHDTSIIIRMMDIDIVLCVPIIGMCFWNFLWPQKPLPIAYFFMNVGCFLGAVLVTFLPFPMVSTVFYFTSLFLVGSVLHIYAVVIRSMKEQVPDAKNVSLAAGIILLIAAWSLADMIWIRTGLDLISWTPFCLSVVFASIFINRYWEMGVELVEKNRQLQRNASQLEDIVARRTEELTDAKHELEQQLHEIQHLQSTLAEQAMRDPLTGLYNRRYMEESLRKEFARAERKDYPISVVMLDIDHFKKLNDTYTHAGGDQVLQVLGNILSSHVRVDDYAIRYGGEEFLIIFPQTPYARAVIRANQLRELIEKIEVKYNGGILKITVSAGVAGFPDHGNTPEHVLSCADIALYKAKDLGRNRVEVYLDGDGINGNGSESVTGK